MVEAMVIQVNRANRVLRLSIKQRIKNINKAEALLNYLQKSQSSSQREKEASPGFADPMAIELDVPLLSVNLQQPILIVEDSKAVRQSLIKWLENIKCTSVGVGTYAEAIEIINKQKFGALLVDVDLPDGNGI